MSRKLWYLENADGGVRPATMEEVEQFRQDNQQGHVVAYEEGEALRVSTVFLFLDHNFMGGQPILYESMVFPLDDYANQDSRRYHTREEALAGHSELVAEWLHELTPQGKRRRR